MSRFSKRLYDDRKARVLADARPSVFISKGFPIGIFIGLGLLHFVSAAHSQAGIAGLVLLSLLGLFFLIVAILLVINYSKASLLGYWSLGALFLLVLLNFITSGTFKIGLLWLMAALLAAKKLNEYDRYLEEKRRDRDGTNTKN